MNSMSDNDTIDGLSENDINYYLTTPTTWTDAQAQAQALGGNLVTINNAQENQFLVNSFGETESFWIGFTDAEQEGNWQWINGESVTYTNWNPGEPNNNGNEDYAIINNPLQSGKTWYDLPNVPPSHFPPQLRGIIEVNSPQPTEGDDTLYGTPGNDTIDGLGGNDLIFGLAGNDSLYGGKDNDTLDGGEGDDYLNPGAGINAVIGGTGVDLLNLDYSTEINNLTINYTDPNNGTISDKSSFSEIEWVIFKSGIGNDTADLSAANYAEFRGNGGNDSFLGGAGNDYLEGGFGSDTLIGGEGNDVIEGWGGGDNFSDEGDYIDAGGGNDVVYGDAGNDSILGGAGNDHLDGVGGNDTLLGGDGDDRQIGNLGGLFGGEGDDLLSGEAGNDELWGQAGNDTVDGGEGDDVLNGNQGNDSISGGEGNDIVYGGKDDDVVFGDAGNDRLFGDLGNDSLWGGEGRDEIIGGDGDDILIGGLGGDTLTGGNGNDQFVYRNFSDRTDQITDFTPSKDLIVLTEVFSNLGYTGTNPINDGYMQLVQSGSNTLVQIDPDGAGFATFKTLVTLQNVLPNDLNDNSFQF